MNLDKVKNLVSEIQDKQATLNKECQKVLEGAFKEIFEKYPKLNTFSFKQYTDYWADGDPVSFSVHSYPESIDINGYNLDNVDCDEEENVIEHFGMNETEVETITEEISELLQHIPEDTMLSIYGDHAEVVVSRTGTVVEDYSNHD